MKFFETLADHVEARWRARRFEGEAFTRVAMDALQEMPPSEHVTPEAIARWFHDEGHTVPQINLEASFGQPPITLVNRSDFYIEALHWMDGTTSIHQHAFSGAFQVLAGSSIHVTYRFDREVALTHRLGVGKMQPLQIEALRRGDTRPIPFGSGLIHALFHLERPTITIVLRTKGELRMGAEPQFNFYKPTLSFEPFQGGTVPPRRMELLEMLRRAQRPEFRTAVEELTRKADMNTLTHLAMEFGPRLDDPLRAMLVERGSALQRDFGTELGRAMEERTRLWNITLRRRDIQSAEHRFLLALLLNLPSTDDILRLVQERYPDNGPASSLVTRWLGDLSRTRVDDPDQPNAIGLATSDDNDIDPTSLAVIEAYLEGLSPELITRRVLEKTGDEVEPENVVEFLEELRRSRMLSNLFQRDA